MQENKVTITHADLERLLKMSLRYALPSNGSSPGVVADLFKAHIGELRTEFIEWAGQHVFYSIMGKQISEMHHQHWVDFRYYLDNNMVNRSDYK